MRAGEMESLTIMKKEEKEEKEGEEGSPPITAHRAIQSKEKRTKHSSIKT